MPSRSMHLHLDGVLFGTLLDYGYETPWAIARITPVDAGAYARLCRASELAAIVAELPDTDDAYDSSLARLAITETDVDLLRLGPWTIVNPGSPLSGPIQLADCGADHWIRWRWS